MGTQKKGLTPIEVLVVITLVAFLLVLLMPSPNRARESAKRSVCGDQLRQTGMAIHAYAGDNDDKMPNVRNSQGDEDNNLYMLYRHDSRGINPETGQPIPFRLACLYEGGYIAEPRVFYCPSNKRDFYRFESYNNPRPWGSPHQVFNTEHNDWIRMGYTYFPTDPKSEKSVWTYRDDVMMSVPDETAKTLLGLDPNIPYITDTIRDIHDAMYYLWDKTKQPAHKVRNVPALNALFRDNHVVFCNEESVFEDPVWQYEDYPTRYAYTYRIFKLINP